MTPKETDLLLPFATESRTIPYDAAAVNDNDTNNNIIEIDVDESDDGVEPTTKPRESTTTLLLYNVVVAVLLLLMVVVTAIAWRQHHHHDHSFVTNPSNTPTTTIDTAAKVPAAAAATVANGPYTVIKEVQEGSDFWNYYNFYEGNDTLGSSGYNTYVNRSYAIQQELIQSVPHQHQQQHQRRRRTKRNTHIDNHVSGHDDDTRDIIYMESKPTDAGPRESIRIEGRTRFTSDVGGLFILDLDHIPAGCGQWPAFWLTDAANWPDNGEIDIVEGINRQNVAKTALHTSNECNMYAHVPSYQMTGRWDRASGIPDTFTGTLDSNTSVPADNCYVMAPHQWMNQGCVIESSDENTMGVGLNTIGKGGINVLQWDPIVTQSIQSYVFLKSSSDDNTGVPSNLMDSIRYASYMNKNRTTTAIVGVPADNDEQISHQHDVPTEVYPDPQSWRDTNNNTIRPYAYFAIGGNTTGCTAQHFNNMNIIFNLAFCGNVAGIVL